MSAPPESPSPTDAIVRRSLRAPLAITATLTAAAILALFVGRVMRWGDWQEPTTLLASTGFVLVALAGGASRFAYGRFVLAGLACCWIGDMVGPHHFMLGAYAFLLAHLLLIPGFLTLRPTWRAAAMAVAPLGLTSGIATALLWPHIPPGDRLSILAYTTVISLMVVVAAGTGHRCRLIPVAAVLFYLSDLFVGRWKYIGGDWNGLFCYPLYYTACLLFAWSVYQVGTKNMAGTADLVVANRSGGTA